MDKFLFDVIDKHLNKLCFFGLLFFAIALRVVLFPFNSGDMYVFLIPWCKYIETHGGFWALKDTFYDYTPLYIYYLTLITTLKIYSIYTIKLLSFAFDFLTAYYIYKIVRLRFPKGALPYVAAFAFLFAPTAILNGSMWGQCDVVFTCFAVISLFYMLKGNYLKAFIFYGLAFSFKIQAIFLLPFFIIFYLKERKFNFIYFLLIPTVYLITLIPCLVAGRDLGSLLIIHFKQLSTYDKLTLFFPSMFVLIPSLPDFLKHFALVGTFSAMGVVLAISWIILKSAKKIEGELALKIAALFVIVIPYFLPRMHERYFFLADTLTLVYAFYAFKDFYLPFLIQMTSFFSYLPYLFLDEKEVMIDYRILSCGVLVLILYFGRSLFKELWPNKFDLLAK